MDIGSLISIKRERKAKWNKVSYFGYEIVLIEGKKILEIEGKEYSYTGELDE